jgi:nuclear mRNA export protein SAC3
LGILCRADHSCCYHYQNHEENERRWAQGSFLLAIRSHVLEKTNGSIPPPWQVWLSTNPDVDGTAIWMERKFDVPASGQWQSESVFAISLSPEPASESFPGMIVFECTPPDGVTDELEKWASISLSCLLDILFNFGVSRKYRVLDDCARLRDVVKTLPDNRHFVPSVLVICWSEGDPKTLAPDFLDMVGLASNHLKLSLLFFQLSKLKEEGVIRGHSFYSITSTTKDLDQKFTNALDTLVMDVEGQLVQMLTIQGMFRSLCRTEMLI